MNIDEYKEAMKEIPFDTAEINSVMIKRINEAKINNLHKYKMVPAFIAIISIVILTILSPGIITKKPGITITAYAAENKGILLTNEFIKIITDAVFVDGESTIDNKGNYGNSYLNFNLNFKCEGKDIDKITYTCTDKKVTRGNRFKASAYYVENITMPVKDYLNYDSDKDENMLNGYYGNGEEKAKITRLIGNSYTVSYDNQMNKQYGIVIAAKVNQDNNNFYYIKDQIIHVVFHMKDGSIAKKKIILHQDKDFDFMISIKVI